MRVLLKWSLRTANSFQLAARRLDNFQKLCIPSAQTPESGGSSSRTPGVLVCVLGTVRPHPLGIYPKDGLCDMMVFSSVYPISPGGLVPAEGSSEHEYGNFLAKAITSSRTEYALSLDGFKRREEIVNMAQSETMMDTLLTFSSQQNIKGYGMIVGTYNNSALQEVIERLSLLFTELRFLDTRTTLFLGITLEEDVRPDQFQPLHGFLDILIVRTHEPASYDKRSQCIVKATASYSSNGFTGIGAAAVLGAALRDTGVLVALSLTMMVVHYVVPDHYYTNFIGMDCVDTYYDTYGEICRPGWSDEPVRDMYQSSTLHRVNAFDVRYYETAETIKQKVEAAEKFPSGRNHRQFSWAVFDVTCDGFTGRECDPEYWGLKYTRLRELKSQMVNPYESRGLREDTGPPESSVRKNDTWIPKHRATSAQKV